MNKEKFILQSATEEDDTLTIESSEAVRKPNPQDPEWTKYIIDQLTKDEKYEEYPKMEGLKRLLVKEYGMILESKSSLCSEPTSDNMYTSIVEHKLVIQRYNSDYKEEYVGIAEGCPDNLESPYHKYPTAIASTRALGRAIRDALKLKNVTVAEEVSRGDDEDMALASQVNGIYLLSKRVGVDILKVINAEHTESFYKKPEDMNREDARKCMRLLNQLGNNPKLLEEYK